MKHDRMSVVLAIHLCWADNCRTFNEAPYHVMQKYCETEHHSLQPWASSSKCLAWMH